MAQLPRRQDYPNYQARQAAYNAAKAAPAPSSVSSFMGGGTPTLNQQMQQFSAGQGAKTNAAGEWANAPTPAQVSAFNQQFSTTTTPTPNLLSNIGRGSISGAPEKIVAGAGTQFAQGNQALAAGYALRKPPTVATSETPLTTVGGAGGFSYDPANPQDYIFRLNAKTATGGKLSADEVYNYQLAQQAQQKATAGGLGDPYAKYISDLEAQKATQEASGKSQMEQALAAKRKELDISYENLKREQLAAGEREKQAGQTATSFTGFGRSTFNADQQVQIQGKTDAAVNQLNAAKEAELQKYQLELQGITGKEVEGITKMIGEYKQAAVKAQVDAISEANKINSSTGAGMNNAVANLLAVATKSGMTIAPGDEAQIKLQADAVKGMGPEQRKKYFDSLGIDEPVRMMIEGIASSSKTETKMYKGKVYERNPVTGTREIQIGGGGGGGGGAYGPAGSKNADPVQNEMINKLNTIKSALTSTAAGFLPRSSILNDPEYQSALNYIKSNMTFEKLSQMKKSGVKLGTLSDSDFRLLGQAALSITPGMKKESVEKEVNRLITGLGGSTTAPNKKTETTAPVFSSGVDAALSLMK